MTNTPQHGQGYEQGRDGSRYGTAAYSPQQPFDRPKPEKVDTLRKVAVLSLVLAAIGSLLGILVTQTAAFQQDMIDYYRSMGLSAELAEQSASGGVASIVGGIVGLLITVALYLVVIIGLSKGKNWARILGIVLVIISIVLSLGGTGIGLILGIPLTAGGALGVVAPLLSIVQLAVDVYWLVLAFNRSVARWFSGDQLS